MSDGNEHSVSTDGYVDHEAIVVEKRTAFLQEIAAVCKKHGVVFAERFRWEPHMFEDFPEFESGPVDEQGHGFIVDLGDLEEAIRLAE